MENEIIEQKNRQITLERNGTKASFELTPEAQEAIIQIGMSAITQTVQAKKEALIAAIDREVEVQISQMEKTAEGQKSALDTHEKKQHDLLKLLELYENNHQEKMKIYAKGIAESSTEEKEFWLEAMKDEQNKYQEKLEHCTQLYKDNNNNLDRTLDKTKQHTGGILNIIGRLFS